VKAKENTAKEVKVSQKGGKVAKKVNVKTKKEQ
jgi:hypothetical protein